MRNGLEAADVLCLKTLGALRDLELDLLALFERTVAVARDGAEVREDVGAAVVSLTGWTWVGVVLATGLLVIKVASLARLTRIGLPVPAR